MCEWIRFRSRSTSRWSDVVSNVSGRPARSRSRRRSAAASSALRKSAFSDQLARLLDLAGHENTEREPKALHHALVEGRQLFGTFARELKLALDLLARELGEVLVDNITDVLEVDRKGDDLHAAVTLALLEAATREFGDVELDGLVELVDHVIHARDLAH